eukprot:Skav223509  [mRNA]  locus=scaffold1160:207113:215164:+ [translate_table: standard]
MMRSMLADQPYSEVVKTQGESAMRELTSTFSTLSPSTSFMSFVSGSNSAFNSSIFFFSSSSSMSRPSLVVLLSFLPSNSFSCCHVQHLDALLTECLQEWRGRDCCNALARDVEDVVLPLLHAVNILLQADLLVARFGGVEAKELGNLGAVGGVFMHPKLQALAKSLVELLVVVLLFCNFRKHLEALLDKVLLDHSEDLVLLQGLTRDVQGKILGIHNTFHKVQPFWHELFAVIHDEHAANVEFDVVSFFLGLEEIKGCPARHEKQGPELKLTLDAEMFHCKVVLPVIRQRLVEGLVLVELFPLMRDFFDLLGLLFLLFLLLLLVNFLDLGLSFSLLFST